MSRLTALFVQRPALASVLVILTAVAGIIAYQVLVQPLKHAMDSATSYLSSANSSSTQAPPQTRWENVATGQAAAVGMAPVLSTPMPTS